MTRVLVIEDEESFRDALQFMLSREGFDVVLAADGAEGMKQFDSKNPDIVLLDLMLPEVSGTEVCKYIRTKSNVPVIMLTAKDTEIDKVVGLELGADDYVTKPFSTRELLARIKAVLRRGTDVEFDSVGAVEGGPIRMDVERHALSVNGEAVSMPLKEFELLEFLMRNSGRVLTRGQLMDRVWGSNYVGDGKTLDVHVKRIRSKIEPDPANPVYLTTVRGLGYRFEA
ncbi:MAG: response regulator transcription factor [Actinobacteria bacterium]|nr:response regulator transcription factor [Actinomycetota bacterium]